MGYPVSYRSAPQPAGGGFQNPSPGPSWEPVSPSNDNHPSAGNDNIKEAIRAANALRKLLRWWKWMNPWLGAALTIWDVMEWYQSMQPQAGGWNMAGWTRVCGEATGRNTRVFQGCTFKAYYLDSELPPGAVFSAGLWKTAFAVPLGTFSGARERREFVGNYTKSGASTDPAPIIELSPDTLPQFMPMPLPEVVNSPLGAPDYIPAINPVPGHKPGAPLPAPKPLPVWSIPYRPNNPGVSPVEAPQWGPAPQVNPWKPPPLRVKPRPFRPPGTRPFPRPGRDPDPRPSKAPSPGPKPNPRPEPSFGPRPGSQDPDPTLVEVLQPGHRAQLAMQPYRARRPEKGTKEKKIYDHKGVWAASKALGWLTEIGDLVDAVYGAIPKKLRLKYRKGQALTLEEKLWHIWVHLDDIDTGQAMWNTLLNGIEDLLVGGVQGLGAQGAVKVGASPLGPGIGGSPR